MDRMSRWGLKIYLSRPLTRSSSEAIEGIDYNRLEPFWFEAIFGFCRWGVGGFRTCSPELRRKNCEESLDCMRKSCIFANENYSITTQNNLPMPHS